MQQLESDLDVTQEKLMAANCKLEQKRDWSLPHKNWISLQLLVMILNVCVKYWRIR